MCRDCSCPALAERPSRPFSTTNDSVPRLSLALFVPPRLSLCLFLRLCRFLVGNISRNSRSERAGAGFLLFCPAPFSKSALKEKRTGTVFRYTVTIDQRDRTTAPAVRASRGEARRSETRRNETTSRDGSGRDERDGDGTRDGTERIWAVTGREENEGRDQTRREGGAVKMGIGRDETERRLARIGGSRMRRLVLRKH